jgi:hypothetical protein
MNDTPGSASSKGKFWLVSADMGYGHQRAISPLKFMAADGKILTANTTPYATKGERTLWKEMLSIYEFMSRAGKMPLIGKIISAILDNLLKIPGFYPHRDRSNSTKQVRYLKLTIRKGLCNGIIEEIRKKKLPVITSFYASAIACEMDGIEHVYCIICDTDLSRVWVAEYASLSRIIYFAPGNTAATRLHSYGVPEKNVIITGFPLPLELLGNRNLDTLKSNLIRRLSNLDPDSRFYNLFKHSVDAYLSINEEEGLVPQDAGYPLTITYTVGGAGAQKEVGKQIAVSLSEKIRGKEVILNLVAGTRLELRDYYNKVRDDIEDNCENIRVIWSNETGSYLDLFNKCLHTTDILWTKPSELSFYCALGIPLILTPAIGPQEKCNRKWLRDIGAGIKQNDPAYTHQWLYDLLKKGRLAEAAWNGFLKGRKYGTYNIKDFLETGTFSASNNPLQR